MGETTSIQWTATQARDGTWVEGATFNPWIGCARVSAECDHCYAESGSKRLAAQHGLKLWESDRFFTGEAYWKQPARWNRAAERDGVRRKVFCASYSDVFEARDDLVDRRARLFALIEGTPNLDWLLLTKRPENMMSTTPASWAAGWPPNVWAGTTVGVRASRSRLEHLRRVPAVVRFVSMEPLLEYTSIADAVGVDWVIIGGESGPKARPFDIGWARRLVYEARMIGAAPFVKQLGQRPVEDGSLGGRLIGAAPARSLSLVDSHGGDWDEWPSDLRVRDYPTPHAARAA